MHYSVFIKKHLKISKRKWLSTFHFRGLLNEADFEKSKMSYLGCRNKQKDFKMGLPLNCTEMCPEQIRKWPPLPFKILKFMYLFFE